jgi:DivIVA domain-containing protein
LFTTIPTYETHIFGLALDLWSAHDLKSFDVIRGGSWMERFGSRLFARFEETEQRADEEFPGDVLSETGNEDDTELTPYHIRSRRFGRRLLGGLDPREVTEFLDQLAEAMHIAQSVNIQTATQVKLLEDEVQALTSRQALGAPSDGTQGAERQATSLIKHDEPADDAPAVSRLEVLRNTTLQEVEALLHDAQARAQALTDAAHKEAEQLVAEATSTAESILTAARDQEAALRHELDRLAESRLRMLDDLWTTLNACHEWLSMVDPRRRGPEQREGRVDRVA